MYKVAIAGDTHLIRNACSLLLKSIGLVVLFHASDGLQLKEFLADANILPDIIFMEIDMPGMNGIDVTEYISTHHSLIKVIAFSIFCNDFHISKILKSGAKGYLTKNTNEEEILLAVNCAMNNTIFLPKAMVKEWKIPDDYFNPDSYKKYKPILLNEKQYEFLTYCSIDLSYKEIAKNMGVSYATVDTYRKAVSKKLAIYTRQGLTAYAIKQGLYIYHLHTVLV
jgi:DNA-binding NarL/FixJ family response regulator